VPHFAFLFFPIESSLHAVNLLLADVQVTSNLLNGDLAALSGLTGFENSLFADSSFFGLFEFSEGGLLVKESALMFALRNGGALGRAFFVEVGLRTFEGLTFSSLRGFSLIGNLRLFDGFLFGRFEGGRILLNLSSHGFNLLRSVAVLSADVPHDFTNTTK